MGHTHGSPSANDEDALRLDEAPSTAGRKLYIHD